MTQEAFKAWWYSEGSQAPYTHHDCEEHTMRMCEIAWANGAYKEREEANAKANASWTLMCKKMVAIEREACAKVCDARLEKWASLFGKDKMYKWIIHLPKAIRARGEQA
jgi:hypothetical protein